MKHTLTWQKGSLVLAKGLAGEENLNFKGMRQVPLVEYSTVLCEACFTKYDYNEKQKLRPL